MKERFVFEAEPFGTCSEFEEEEIPIHELSGDRLLGEIVDPTDPRIDVSAKFALMRMLKAGPSSRLDAAGMIGAINSGQLTGIFGDDLAAAAKLAQRLRTVRWKLVPKGEDAALVVDPLTPRSVPPTIIFRGGEGKPPNDGIRRIPQRLDPALRKAWASFLRLRAKELTLCPVPQPGGGVVAETPLLTPVSNVVPPILCQTPQPSSGEDVRARCGPMGCPFSTVCGGEVMALTDCGTGPCTTCPPGLDLLLVRGWCAYTGVRSAKVAVILILPLGARLGPICL